MSFAAKACVGALVIALSACTLTDLDDLGPGATAASSGAGASGGQVMVGGGATSSSIAQSSSTGPGVNAYRDAVMMDQPLGYWRLGENGALEAADETGSYTGNYSGAFMQGASGALANDPNTAVEFPGQGFVDFGDVLDLADSTLSIELWIKPAELTDGEYHHIVCKRLSDIDGEQGYGINFSTGLGLNFVVVQAGQYNGVNYMLTSAAWHHVVGTFDGNTARLYINGADVGSSLKMIQIKDTVAPLLIGGYDILGNGSFLGAVDEVAIYDEPLSLSQVSAHYAAAGTR